MYNFGCVCFIHLPPHERHELFTKSIKCAFMEYSISHKGYVCYDLGYNKFHISRHVVFFENQSFFSTHFVSLPKMLTHPNCDELNPTLERFKPKFVNEHVQLCRFLS